MRNVIPVVCIIPLLTACAGSYQTSENLDISISGDLLEIKSSQYGAFGYSCNSFEETTKTGEHFSFKSLGRFKQGATLRNAKIQNENESDVDINNVKSINILMEENSFLADWSHLKSASILEKMKAVTFEYDNSKIKNFYQACLSFHKVTKEKREEEEKNRRLEIENRKNLINSLIDKKIKSKWDGKAKNGGELDLDGTVIFQRGSDNYYTFLRTPNVAYYTNLSNYVVKQPIDNGYFLLHGANSTVDTFPIIFMTKDLLFTGDRPNDYVVIFKGVINYKNALGVNRQAILLSE